MSCLNLGKKLLPARKAWKSFTVTLHKKLHKLKRSKSIINKTTSRFDTSTLRAVLRCSRRCDNKKKRSLTKFNKPCSSALHVRPQCHRQQRYSPVYVDELFMDTAIKFQVMNNNKRPVLEARSVEDQKEVINRTNEVTHLKKLEIGSKKKLGNCDLHDGSSTSSSSSVAATSVLEMRGVDERAEEFIAKFRKEMRLQRDKSYGEFLETLARGL